MNHYAGFMERFEGLEGWFSPESAAIWDILLTRQAEENIAGNIAEIGVFKGKSAAMLALHSRTEETLLLVDPWTLSDDVRGRITAIKPANTVFCPTTSVMVWNTQVIQTGRFSFRWIHIDGEHTGVAVDNDLRLTLDLLGDRGIVVVDDFFNPAYPQITWAVIRFLERHPYDLTPFLCGYNKAYLCRPAALRDHLAFIKERLLQGMIDREREVIVYKSTYPADLNCFGVGAHYDKNLAQLRGPDWAGDTIEI